MYCFADASGIQNEHLNTQNHKLRVQHSRYMTAVEQSETDKNGVIFLDSSILHYHIWVVPLNLAGVFMDPLR